MIGKFVVGLGLASMPTMATSASPVGKVIELIDGLKVKVQKDLDTEKKAMKEYTQFCDDEQTEKGFAIKTASSEIEGYKAVIEETTGSITEVSSQIETASSEVASKESELASATKIRSEESSDFNKAEKELVESVDALSRAVTIIKREMSFIQVKGDKSQKKEIEAMTAALGTIINATWIDATSKAKIQAFVETTTDDELSLKQPQASVKNYESHSKGIVETLEDMKDKAEGSLRNLRKDEMKAKHSFEMIKQSLSDQITNLNKEIDEATASVGAAQEKLAKAQGDLADTEATKAADEDYKSKLITDCNAKAAEWDERQKTAADELAALTKGADILKTKFNFAQISVTVTHKSTVTVVEKRRSEIRNKLVTVLKSLGKKYSSFGLMQIANSASADPFVKVRGLINDMIAKLEKQAQEEATHDTFCKEETSKSSTKKDMTQAAVDKLQARIDAAKAAKSELKTEVATLSDEIAEINSAMKKANAIRNQEHADYKVASKDYKEAAEACTQALVVLKDFYAPSFVQVSTEAPEFGSSRSDAGHVILEILEVAESDFTRLLAEAETSETEAAEAFNSLKQSNDVSKAKKETSVKAKNSEIKSIEVALTHHNEDYENTSSELSAILDYIEKLKPQCESKAMTYEERKAARDAEIAGLQEALTMLEGEDISSFIQAKSFLTRK